MSGVRIPSVIMVLVVPFLFTRKGLIEWIIEFVRLDVIIVGLIEEP